MALNKLKLGTALSTQISEQNDNLDTIDTQLDALNKLGKIESIYLNTGEQTRFDIPKSTFCKFILTGNEEEGAVEIIVTRVGSFPLVVTKIKDNAGITIQRNADGSAIFLTSARYMEGVKISSSQS